MSITIGATLNPGALQSDGAYVYESIVPNAIPLGAQSQTLMIDGAANWGPLNTLVACSNYDTGVPLMGDTFVTVSTTGSVDYGIMARVSLAGPECTSFLLNRVGDGTQAAATSDIADQATPASSHNILAETALWTGSFGNRIGRSIALVSGNSGLNPVYAYTISPPTGQVEVFNIVGYATLGGAYNATAFTANAIAAVNGSSNSVASKWIRLAAAASPSSVAPYVGTLAAMSGGVDGSAGLTDSLVVGTNATGAARTGMYAFSGAARGGNLVLAGVSSYTAYSAMATFCQTNLCVGYWSFPINTDTIVAVPDRNTNALTSQFMQLSEDWVQFNDPAQGIARYLEPAAKVAGIVAGQPAFLYAGNKPVGGTPNVISTERTVTIPINIPAESGLRESNGINWIGNPIPRGNVFGLFHGMMSDGLTTISDVRMAFNIGLGIEQILGQFVGQMQGTSNNDTTRAQARAAVNAYMNQFLPPNQQQINSYTDVLDTTNNTPTSIAQGIMLCSLEVETLAAVRFAVAAVQVGTGVQISVTNVNNV